MPAAEHHGTGKVALVTGAASGIGRATAQCFLGAGYAVAALDRDADGLESLVGESPDGEPALTLVADLMDEATIEAALEQALGWKGRAWTWW